jgi:uncharacterized damage-inducible protein DinB
MKGTEAIQSSLRSTGQLLAWFLSDLTDEDLLVRPAEGANHLAWQLGHLIVAEKGLVSSQLPQARYPELPAGFAEQHASEKAGVNPPVGFATKQVYLDLFEQVRQITIDTVGQLSDEDLDQPTTGNMAKFAPKLGDLLLLASHHTLMHGGQFTVARRKLGKPILF